MKPAVDRVLAKVNKLTPSGCWLFDGNLDAQGYGRVTVGRRGEGLTYTHIVVYEALVGPVPDGLQLDHVKARGCVSKACCNPDHLEPVTSRENILRGEGPAAKHARQTHCVRGHLLAGDNIYRQPSRPNSRFCRECRRIYHRRAAA